MNTSELLTKYLKGLRSENKRAYAFAYLAYKRGQLPASQVNKCSTMAAQEVRMNIDAAMDGFNC